MSLLARPAGSLGPQKAGARRCPAPPAEVREGVMDRIVVAAAIGMGLVFVTGVMVGIVLMVAMAIRKPDRR